MLPGKTRYGKTRHFEHHKGVGLVQIYDNTIIRSHGLKWDLGKCLILYYFRLIMGWINGNWKILEYE